MDEKIGLLFGNLGQGKTELVRKWAQKTGLPVVEIRLVNHHEKLQAIHDYRLAKEQVSEAKERLKEQGVGHEMVDMQDTLCSDVSDEEMYNLVTDMAMNMDLIDVMEGSDGSE